MISRHLSIGDYSKTIYPIFLPNTKAPTILVLPKENFLELFSLKTSQTIGILKNSTEIFKKIESLVVSKNNKFKILTLGVGLQDGSIEIWNIDIIKTKISCTIFKGHSSPVISLTFSIKKILFFSGCQKGCLVFWDLNKKKGIFRVIKAHDGKISILCFISKNNFGSDIIISFGSDNLIKFWDTKTFLCIRVITFFYSISFASQIKKKNKILIFSPENLKLMILNVKKFFDLEFHTKSKLSSKFLNPKVFWENNNSLLFLYGKSKILEIFFFRRNSLKIKIKKSSKKYCLKNQKNQGFEKFFYSFKENIAAIDVWKDSLAGEVFLLIQYFSKFLEVYHFHFLIKEEINQSLILKKIYSAKLAFNQSDIRDLIWFSNDFLIACLCGSAKLVNIWLLNSQKCQKILPLKSKGLCMSLITENRIIVGTKSGEIDLFDLDSGSLIFSKVKAHLGPIWSLDILKNLFQIATGGADGILRLWTFDSEELNLLKYLEVGNQILGLKVIFKRNLIVVNCLPSKLVFFSLNNLRFSFSFEENSMPFICIGIGYSDSLLVAGSADCSLKIWDLEKRQILRNSKYHDSSVTGVLFQKFTGNLFSGTRDGKICFWSRDSFFLICKIENYHVGPIWALKISENGKFLATGSQCKKLNIWKINQINPLVCFSKNGNNNFFEHQTFFVDEKTKKQKNFGNIANKSTVLSERSGIKKKEKHSSESEEKSKKLEFFLKTSTKQWIALQEKLKVESGLKFFNFIFDEILKNKKIDFFYSVKKLQKFLKIFRKKQPFQNNIDFIKFEKRIKIHLNETAKKLESSLAKLLLFQKSQKIRKSDLPDSN